MAKRQRLKSVIDAPRRVILHDRRARDVPELAEVGVVNIQDPYAQPPPMERNKQGEWQTGDREQLTVILSFKKDPIGRMYARSQIRFAEYEAARAFQRLHDDAQIGVIRAIDPAKEVVDGGMIADVLTDKQQSAIRRIRSVEGGVCKRHGSQGVAVLNGVLVDKMTILDVAYNNGAYTPKKIDYWRELFRLCLHRLGIEMGTIRELG